MEPDFGEFFKLAYVDAVPKRLIAAAGCVFLALIAGRVKRFFPKPNAKVLLAVLFTAGLLVRAGWVIISPTHFSTSYEDKSTDLSESSLINLYSAQIARGGVPLNTDGTLALRRPVGYLYMLGAIYKIFGERQMAAKILQVLMGSLLIPLFYFLALRMFKREGPALLAAAITAFYPFNVFSVNILLDEFPFFLFTFAAYYLTAKNIETRTVKHGIATGLLLGLAAASRTHAVLFPWLFFAAYLFYRLPFKKVLVQTVLSIALIYAVNAPWAAVTAKYYGKAAFFPTLPTGFFYCGLNDKASWQNIYSLVTKEDGADPGIYAETDQFKITKRANQLALEWTLHHPAKAAQWAVQRNLVLYGFQLDDTIIDLNQSHAVTRDSFAVRYVHPLRKIASWAYSTLALLALAGIFVLTFNRREFFWKNYPSFLLILLSFAYWIFIHSFLFGFRKYRWFADLLMIYPASFFLTWIGGRWKRS